MIVLMKKKHSEPQLHDLLEKIKSKGCKTHLIHGSDVVTVSLIGDTRVLSLKDFEDMPGVERVARISKPFKLAAKEGRDKPTVLNIGGLSIGEGHFLTMAGPCCVESEEGLLRIAHAVKKAGATILRGGAYKPRSSPYSFQGMGEEGLKIMQKAKKETGLLLISEAMDVEGMEVCLEYVDIIQIGARNMQNFSFLKALGKIKKPVMLKRGMSATIEEWLMSAEYILSGGNDQLILCERGIRTFDSQYSRNTLDLNAVPILKELTHLPIIIDPSHGTGHRHMVAPLALAAMAVGSHGVIVEVHDQPEKALSDGPQALYPDDFTKLMGQYKKISEALDIDFQTVVGKNTKVA